MDAISIIMMLLASFSLGSVIYLIGVVSDLQNNLYDALERIRNLEKKINSKIDNIGG